MNYDKPKCTFCNVELIPSYEMDLQHNDSDTYNSEWIGFCPRCGEYYSWRATYRAIDFSNIVQLKKDEL